jgi:DnaJ family protein A protein 2
LQKAYEVLSDENKRAIYDEQGEEGLENGGGGGGGNPMDIFDVLSGRAGRGGDNGKRKGEEVVFPLKVSLEDLYNGMTKKLRLTKNVICDGCAGKGGKADSVQKCNTCKGRGVRMVVRQLGPGMIQQMQTQCGDCNGEGSVIDEKDKCKKCRGNKTVKEKKTLEVFISRGSTHGEKIVFRGEADEAVPWVLPFLSTYLVWFLMLCVLYLTYSRTLFLAMSSWSCNKTSTRPSSATVPI